MGLGLLRQLLKMLYLHEIVERSRRMGHSWSLDNLLPPWLNALIPFLNTLWVVVMVLSVVTAYALLSRRTWGRTFAMVSATIALFAFPVGTALGIYTLWVLAPVASRAEYETTVNSVRGASKHKHTPPA